MTEQTRRITSASQGMPMIVQTPEPGQGRKDARLEVLEGAWCLDVGFLDFTAVREQISVVRSPRFTLMCEGSCGETDAGAFTAWLRTDPSNPPK